MSSSRTVVRHPFPHTAIVVACALALGACGGRDDGDGGAAAVSPGAPSSALDTASLEALLAVGDPGRPAADVSTDALRLTAVEHVAGGAGANLDAIGRIGRASDTVTAPVTAFARQRTDSGAFDDGTPGVSAGTRLLDGIDTADDEADTVLRALLGLDGALARVTREGDALSIDPDDEALCTAMAGEGPTSATDTRVCRQLAGRLATRLDASSADSGWLALDIDGGEALRLGYGPVNSVLELDLGALAAFEQDAAVLAGETGPATRASGRVRLTLGAPERAVGAERTSLALDLLTPLSITDSDGFDLALGAARVFELAADAGAGRMTLAVDLGALRVVVPDAFSGSSSILALAGLTGHATLDVADDTLVVRDLGIGRGPLTWTVDGRELGRFEVGDFGFRLDGDTGQLALHGDLSAAWVMRQVIEGASYAFTARVAAPDGTRITEHGEDGFRVDSGDVSASLGAVTPEGSVERSLSVRTGECAAPGPDDAFDVLPVVVPCR